MPLRYLKPAENAAGGSPGKNVDGRTPVCTSNKERGHSAHLSPAPTPYKQEENNTAKKTMGNSNKLNHSEESENLELHPSMCCMSYEQLIEFRDNSQLLYGKAYRNFTMRDVVDRIVKPVCKESKACYAQYLNPDGLKVSAFITHTWDENFQTFVESIESVFETTMQKPNLWICAFALFQGNEEDIKEQVDGKDQSLEMSPFVQALKEADFFVVVRNSKTDLYSRIWCVCELMFAMDYGMVPDKTYVTGPGTFENSSTSCLEAESWSKDDKDRILNHLLTRLRPEEVDEKIQAFREKGAPSRLLKDESWLQRYKWPIFLVVGFLLAGLTFLSVHFATKIEPASLPTEAPTTFEERVEDYVREMIQNKLPASAEMNEQALSWVANQRLAEGEARYNDERAIVQYSLVDLYLGISSEDMQFIENKWMPGTNEECDWKGVTCIEGIVAHLNITDNDDLKGTIPPAMSLLSNSLSSLDLSRNSLEGSLPSELFSLTKLTSANLSQNNLKGGIPGTVGKAISLVVLNLSDNQLSSTLPPEIGSATSLVELNLANNKLSGSIPTEIGQLINLDEFTVGNNALSYKLPTEIGNLVSLSGLHLQSNDLLGPIPSEMGRLSNLKRWDMSNNHVFDKIPRNLSQGNSLVNLEALDLSNNLLTGDTSNGIDSNVGLFSTKLTSLKLNNNFFRGNHKIVSDLGKLTGLEVLDISSNFFSGTVPRELFDRTGLKKLNLGGNTGVTVLNVLLSDIVDKSPSLIELDLGGCRGVKGTIPSEIGLMVDLPSLNLYLNQLTGSIPSEIGHLVNLQRMDLDQNQLTGSIPSEIGNLVNIQQMVLRFNPLKGSIPSEIGNLVKMQEMHLMPNQLTGSIPSEIGNLVKMQEMSLSDNQLTGSIPSEIGNLVKMQDMWLDHNQLTGSIPSEIGNLIDIYYMDLSNNQLTGSIPSEIGNLIDIYNMWFGYNQLTGSIPSEVGNLIEIYSMDLSNNQLTGSVPPEIGNLVNIGQMNFGYNQLTGSIPSEIGNLVNIQGMNLYFNHLTGLFPSTFCSMDSNPRISIDCDEVNCSCCVSFFEESCPTEYPTSAPTLSLSPSTTPTASYLPTLSKTPSLSLAPSLTPSNSPAPTQELINITIEIKLGYFPEDTGWNITDIGNNTIKEMPFGTYTGKGPDSIIYEQVSLKFGYEYTFNLFDSWGDGFNGRIILYLGDEANPDQMLGFYNHELQSFTNHYEIPFLAHDDGIIPNIEFPTTCRDDHDSCSDWANIGECSNNPGYMLSNCKKSCGQC